MKAHSIRELVDHLQKRAQAAWTKGLQRLQKAGRLRLIRGGFDVIVPLASATGDLGRVAP